MTVEQAGYKRAVQVIVYDMQGGPLPEQAIGKIINTAEQVAEQYNGLAITVVEE